MLRTSRTLSLVWSVLAVGLSACSTQQDASGLSEAPYVVMLSLDGFRYDYQELHGAPNLARLATQGIRAEGMIPSYTSSTFPNHYSIVTGLYPEHHGIVNNSFYDRERDQVFVYTQPEGGRDGSWYGGIPLWVLAEQQGVKAASYFWVASDTEIEGVRPSYYYDYDESVPNTARVEQVLAWLRLPEAERPHFITLYFSDVDSAGHEYGPEAPETKAAVAEVDARIGELMDGIEELGLPVNLFVVADHGMIDVEGTVSLGTQDQFDGFEIAPNSGTQVMLYSDDAAKVSATVQQLNERAATLGGSTGDPAPYTAYLREQTPEHLHYRENSRIGDIVVIPNRPIYLAIEPAGGEAPRTPPAGAHGYDPAPLREMDAIFYAAGPSIRPGATVDRFENVHVYPLIARILGLEVPADLDGDLTVLQGILRQQP